MPKKAKNTVLFVCNDCGEEHIQWQGRCSNCGAWNTLKEFKVPESVSATHAHRDGYNGKTAPKPVRLSEITGEKEQRFSSGFNEVDRVLGGGIVRGSVMLLGGDPGIGKSTLLLQVAQKAASLGSGSILYVSGEESPTQIKLRAQRLGAMVDDLQILAATNIDVIQAVIEKEQPALVIIDSIQTMYDPQFPSTPGSIVQVRETAIRIQQTVKALNIPVVLVGHITKEGTVAGPRTLEHLVDVVLYLEGDSQQELRILRAAKNRFGDSTETGIFAMEEEGMVEVANPGNFLISERVQVPGSVLSAVLEGTRPILIEVQALTTASVFGYPRRTASGFDLNRLNLLLAVLQRRAGINLSDQDVFINIVGGLKVKDPSVDAAICIALASAFKDKTLSEKLCIIGEVGLGGELRKGREQARRVKQIGALGYFVPTEIKSVSDLLKEAFSS